MDLRGGFVPEIDLRKFFDTPDHGQLRTFLQRRVRDGVLLRLIGKWLNAGASLQFYSDGAVNVDGLPVFPPNVGTLPQLGRFNKTPKGLSIGVGDLFSLPGIAPLAATDIVITSDGDAPEPTTLVLSAIGLAGLVLFAQRQQRCVALANAKKPRRTSARARPFSANCPGPIVCLPLR